jgi:Flp pilus assembly pilin Flp
MDRLVNVAAGTRRAAERAVETSRTGECMRQLLTNVRRFGRDESGIAVTEYGLLVALVAVLLIAVVMIFGSSISSWFAARTSIITTV